MAVSYTHLDVYKRQDIVQDMPLSLRGKGTLIGIVDSGIDYENAEFRNEDGTTRIVSLWDQSVNGRPPAGYSAGTEYTREQICLLYTSKAGQWVKVRAKVRFANVSVYRGEGPVLEAEHIEAAEPIEELVYFN